MFIKVLYFYLYKKAKMLFFLTSISHLLTVFMAYYGKMPLDKVTASIYQTWLRGFQKQPCPEAGHG
jgi:uncharacterized membrane protein